MQKLFVVSGGLGLLGQRVVRHIISGGRGSARVMIVDAAPPVPGGAGDALPGELAGCDSEGVSVVRGDLRCSDVAASIVSFGTSNVYSTDGGGAAAAASSLSVFHLASVMSGQGEQDFDEAIRVNIDGMRSMNVHDAVCVLIVFSSVSGLLKHTQRVRRIQQVASLDSHILL